jgi:hypothetical protein
MVVPTMATQCGRLLNDGAPYGRRRNRRVPPQRVQNISSYPISTSRAGSRRTDHDTMATAIQLMITVAATIVVMLVITYTRR